MPRATSGSENQKHTSDILKSTDQYRISIEANPTVPVLDIYSQAPTKGEAAILANAAVDSLRQYLTPVLDEDPLDLAVEAPGIAEPTGAVRAVLYRNVREIVGNARKHGMSLENCVQCRTCEMICPEVNLRVNPTEQGSGPDFMGL